MRNTIIVTVLLFVGVIAASIFYFRDINKEQHNTLKPLKYLPDNTYLIASIKNDEITDNIFKDFDLFDALLGHQEMELIKRYKNQILRHEALYEFIEGQDVFLSFHPHADSLDMLFTVPTAQNISESDVNNLMNAYSANYKIQTIDTLSERITAFSFGTPDTTLYATYYQQVLFASYSKDIILAVLNKSIPKLSEKQIDYFIQHSSRNTPLSVFFPHQNDSAVVKHFQQREKGIFSDQFVGLQGQSAWNINFKQDALMLTGESEVDNSKGNYIALFRNQTKKTQRLYNYFPSNTAVFMEYSISNYAKFEADLKQYFEAREEFKKLESTFQNLADSSSSIGKLSHLLQHNFALVEQTNQVHVGFIGIADTARWKDIENRILEDEGEDIFRFRNANVLYALYGEVFKYHTRPYVSRVDDVLVVANSRNELQNYINNFRRKDLLTGTLGFKNFEKLQGNEANVTLFVHNKNSFSKILYSLPIHYQKKFRNKENYGYQDFYSWSLQLSGNNGNFSSQVYALYKSKNALGSTPTWTYQLEDRAITAPYVFEHSDTSRMILIQELDHTLHAIHPSGNKLWSTIIAGRIIGEIQQLADRSILLVTDRSRLYRLDTNGKNLKGFSTGIPNEPLFEPTLFKTNDQEIILVPTANSIYAYTMEGNRYTDWDSENISQRITTNLILTQKNEVLFGTDNGTIIWLNDKGKTTSTEKIPSDSKVQSIMDFSNLKVQAVVDDGLVYRSREGTSHVRWELEELKNKFWTGFRQISGTAFPELILLNENQLKVYNNEDSLQLQFEHYFTRNIDNKPQFFKNRTSNDYFIGIASKATNLLYLFGDNGAVLNGFPVEGQPLFYYGGINYNSETYLLCMRRDKKLYAFKHQK